MEEKGYDLVYIHKRSFMAHPPFANHILEQIHVKCLYLGYSEITPYGTEGNVGLYSYKRSIFFLVCVCHKANLKV